MTDYIQKTMPEIKLIPILGNHELNPIDNFDVEAERKQLDIVSLAAGFWKDILPPDALEQFKKTGGYTMMLDKNRKVRLINTFVAHDDPLNIVQFHMRYDPTRHLEWFRDTMAMAEKNGEDVFIIRHIPFGSDNNLAANRHYEAIFERYANIIRGVFAGHSHHDE